jgi:hypothetical protein
VQNLKFGTFFNGRSQSDFGRYEICDKQVKSVRTEVDYGKWHLEDRASKALNILM